MTYPCGHPKTPDNTRINHARWPLCRICANARSADAMRRKKEIVTPWIARACGRG